MTKNRSLGKKPPDYPATVYNTDTTEITYDYSNVTEHYKQALIENKERWAEMAEEIMACDGLCEDAIAENMERLAKICRKNEKDNAISAGCDKDG